MILMWNVAAENHAFGHKSQWDWISRRWCEMVMVSTFITFYRFWRHMRWDLHLFTHDPQFYISIHSFATILWCTWCSNETSAYGEAGQMLGNLAFLSSCHGKLWGAVGIRRHCEFLLLASSGDESSSVLAEALKYLGLLQWGGDWVGPGCLSTASRAALCFQHAGVLWMAGFYAGAKAIRVKSTTRLLFWTWEMESRCAEAAAAESQSCFFSLCVFFFFPLCLARSLTLKKRTGGMIIKTFLYV